MNAYRTPLRYPGGKQKLAPFILEVMQENGLVGGHYAEPYAGGAGVGIALLLAGNVSHIHLNDSSKAIYSFWKSILGKTDEFCRAVATVPLTVQEWRVQREILSRPDEFDELHLGFSLFYLNRCNRSGIPSPSAGLIGGLKQNGKWKMDARFPREELIRRIEMIGAKANNITVKNLDAEKFILKYLPKLQYNTLVYCDPPYYHKSDKLYLNHYKPEDHIRIAQTIQNHIPKRWLVSYDCASEIVKSYSNRRQFAYNIQYNAARVYKGRELFIFSDDLKLPKISAVPGVNAKLKRKTPKFLAPI